MALPHQSARNPGAPGTPGGPPRSGSEATLNPKPRPTGKPPGGFDPMHTKPPKSGAAMDNRGERNKTGHATTNHNKQGQAQRAADEAKAKKKPAAVSVWDSKADKTRVERILRKNETYKTRLKLIAVGPVGGRAQFDVMVPPVGRTPMMKVARSDAGEKAAVTTEKAVKIAVVLRKTDKGVVRVTVFGLPKVS